jgi:outer membrane receptor protein involved in Fe transport
MFYNPSDNTINQKTTNEAITYKTTQFSDNFDNGKFGNLQWGADYDINTKNSLSSSVRYGIRGFNNTQDITSTTLKNEVSYNSFTRNVKNTNQNQSVDINLDYVRKFENPQKEFGILTQFSQSNSDNSFTFTQNGVSTSNPNTGLTREGTFQMDFQTPISTNQIFEIGAKNVYRNISNDYQYLLKEKLEINTFNLNQNVSSSYLSYTLTTKNKFSFKPGLRYEYTLNDASLKDAKLNVKDYGNLVPSLQISKNLGGGKTMKASYNRRIQRPSLRFLSPGANTANTQNITIGNPELLPELTNAYELNLSAFKKATSVNVSLFFRDTKDAITQVRNTTESGGIITQYFNVGKSQSYGINLFGSTRITQKWQLNIGSNIFNQTVSNPSTNQSNSGVVVEGNFFLMGQLPKNWAFQAFGFLRGPQVQLQGRQSGYGTLNMGIRKDFKDKKGSIGLSLDNPFTKRLRFVSTFDADGLYQENINYRYNRGIRLTFSRQFGKMTFGNMNRKKKINNDDTKQDDSGNQGGGSVPR